MTWRRARIIGDAPLFAVDAELQAYMNAHLRPLQRCSAYGCDRPATQELYSGVNAPCGAYCDRHAQGALEAFKRQGEVMSKQT